MVVIITSSIDFIHFIWSIQCALHSCQAHTIQHYETGSQRRMPHPPTQVSMRAHTQTDDLRTTLSALPTGWVVESAPRSRQLTTPAPHHWYWYHTNAHTHTNGWMIGARFYAPPLDTKEVTRRSSQPISWLGTEKTRPNKTNNKKPK